MFPMDFIDFSKATKEQLHVIVHHDEVDMEYKRLAWQRLKMIVQSEKELAFQRNQAHKTQVQWKKN